MNTIDLSIIREQNEYWFEEIDTTCPFCDGTGEDKKGDSCEHCDSGNFEIYWDICFEVPYLKDKLDFDKARKIAFKQGWLLFMYNNDMYIAAGSCGYDFTWVRAKMILDLCGTMPIDYAHDLSNGGDVFVSDKNRKRIIRAQLKVLRAVIRNARFDIANLKKQLVEIK